MRLAKALLIASALVSGTLGVACLLATGPMAAIVGVLLPTATARADYRAMYGGAEVGMAVFWAIAALRVDWVHAGLASVAIILFGFGLARFASALVDGPVGPLIWGTVGLELISGLITLWALRGLGMRISTAFEPPRRRG